MMGHCFRNAKSAEILGAKDLNKNEIEEGFAHAKARRKQLKKEAHALGKIQMITEHLKAISNGKEARAKEI